jgi:DinB family protein
MIAGVDSLKQSVDALQIAVQEAPGLFRRFTDPQAELARRPGLWSRKQILGHLIDSAANNHQRFVRIQLEGGLELPGYAQEDWVAAQYYQRRAWPDLIELWTVYNRHLLHVIQHVPIEVLSAPAKVGGEELTLEFVIIDYVRHLNHHVAQIAEPI